MEPNSPINPVTPNEQPVPTPTPKPQPTSATTTPAKKSNKLLIIILCSIIGLIAIIAVAIALIMSNSQDSKTCSNNKNIIGVWESTSTSADKYTYAFDSDGNGVAMLDGSKTEFTYTVTCSELIANWAGIQRIMKLQIDGDTLTLSEVEYYNGYEATFKRVSTNPKDIDSGSSNTNLRQSTNNTERCEALSHLLSEMTSYLANNRGKAPSTESTFDSFIENYIDDDYKTDPDGTDYNFKYVGQCFNETTCWGKGNNEKVVKEPTGFDHTIYYFYSAKCGSDDNVIGAEKTREIAFYYKLEGNQPRCVSNSN